MRRVLNLWKVAVIVIAVSVWGCEDQSSEVEVAQLRVADEIPKGFYTGKNNQLVTVDFGQDWIGHSYLIKTKNRISGADRTLSTDNDSIRFLATYLYSVSDEFFWLKGVDSVIVRYKLNDLVYNYEVRHYDYDEQYYTQGGSNYDPAYFNLVYSESAQDTLTQIDFNDFTYED